MSTLSKDKLYRLILRAQGGDKKALEEILVANQGLVRSIANKQYNIHKKRIGSVMDIDDLISEGNIGLMRCIQKFDTSMDLAFSTYATVWIEQKCKVYIRNQYSAIRVPVGTFEKIMHKKLSQFSEFSDIEKAGTLALHVGSLNLKIREDSDEELIDSILDSDGLGPEDDYIKKETHDRLQRMIDKYLSEREAKIIKYRNNWDNLFNEGRTLEDIGCEMNLTRERVRQIEKKAYEKIRKHHSDVDDLDPKRGSW